MAFFNVGGMLQGLQRAVAQKAQGPTPGQLFGPLPQRVPPKTAAQRKAASQKPGRLMTGQERDALILGRNDIPPYNDRYGYQPPGTVDHQTVWQYHLPGYLTMPGRGVQGDQRPPVPHADVLQKTPEQAAALQQMVKGVAAKSTPFTGDWHYQLAPKDVKRVQKFSRGRTIVSATPSLGLNGHGHGYNMIYRTDDGENFIVPVRVERSYGS